MAYTREERARYMQDYRARRRAEAIVSLGGACVTCGSRERLEFDHIDPATKRFGISSRWHAKRSEFEAEVAKCQLLCHDCHVSKTSEDLASIPTRHGSNHGYVVRSCRCLKCIAWYQTHVRPRRAATRKAKL